MMVRLVSVDVYLRIDLELRYALQTIDHNDYYKIMVPVYSFSFRNECQGLKHNLFLVQVYLKLMCTELKPETLLKLRRRFFNKAKRIFSANSHRAPSKVKIRTFIDVR